MTVTVNPGPVAGSAAGLGEGGGPSHHSAGVIPQDRLIRKEVALGVIREIVPPQDHIGLSTIAPLMSVPTDDVIFQYAQGITDGLSPARAEDAESETYQRDDTFLSEGRASVIDWAIKDRYTSSDVSRYREWLEIQQRMRDTGNLPLLATSATEGWQQRLARDTARRRRRLDNRLEWLIMSALSTGSIAYNDGKIKFTVDYGRPSAQMLVPGGSLTSTDGGTITMGSAGWLKTDGTGDPISDILKLQNWAYDTYGVRLTRAIASRKVLTGLWASSKFVARTGLITQSGSTEVDPKYVIDGWSPQAAQTIIENATMVKFLEYDSVYRTRPVGSTTVTNNRFLPANRIIFLPDEGDIAQFDDTEIGFAKTLTSPHPAGNWQSGFYEWEKDHGQDPWGYDVGTGIKAFPVFLHMDLTFAYDLDLSGAA